MSDYLSIKTYDIPFYPGYKLTENRDIIGKKGYILSPCGTSHLFVNVYVNRKPSVLYIHRAVALVHVPGYFKDAWVDHIDDNPRNNDPSNLRWVTPGENNYLNKDIKSSIERCKNAIIKSEAKTERLKKKLQLLESQHNGVQR